MSILDFLANGLWDISGWGIVAYTLVLTHITIVSVTVYLHRYSAHRALELHPALAHFFRLWLWLTTGMLTREWTAIHRKHHAVCETDDDPHSPVKKGLSTIVFRGAEAYREEAAKPETLERYGKGCPDDWVERNVYSRSAAAGVGTLLVTNLVLFGAIGATVWAVQMVWIPFLAAGVINGVGHYWGYRNFECPDAATNIVPWGILIGGEELHNNHHTYPNSAKLSQKRFELDVGWMWIRLFETLGLATVRSTGPVVEKVPGKSTMDMDTAWAVLNDRFRVMARYGENVVAPLVEQEYRKADEATRRVLKRARKMICRDDSLLDDQGRRQIDEIVESSPEIRQVYELRVGLHDVWSKRGGNAEELLSALKAWCVSAEGTGMQTLREFVEELKSYSATKMARA